MKKKLKKTIIIGFDSLSLNVIKEFVKDNKLPCFKKLLEKGYYSKLESSIPPITFPAWKCYSTGCQPNKLGVYSFISFDRLKKEIKYFSSLDFKKKDYWEILNKNDIKTAIINLPGTFPIKEGYKNKNNSIISDFLGNEEKIFFFPDKLKKLIKEVNYKINPLTIQERDSKKDTKWINKYDQLFKTRFELAKKLIDKVDLLHLTIFYIDKIHHNFIDNKDILLRFWSYLDYLLQDFINFLNQKEKDYYLFIISDHGSCGIKKSFNINSFLISHKYLYLNRETSKREWQLKIKRILSKLPFYQEIVKLLLSKKLRGITKKINKQIRSSLINQIDFKKTIAFGIGEGFSLVYLNKELENKEKKELKSKIDNYTDNEGNILCQSYWYQEAYGCEPDSSQDNFYPDLIVVPNKGFHVSENFDKHIFTSKPLNGWKGTHQKNGFFLACGPKIKSNKTESGLKKDKISILDLAPTILHLYKIPTPKEMDGRVLKELFND